MARDHRPGRRVILDKQDAATVPEPVPRLQHRCPFASPNGFFGARSIAAGAIECEIRTA
jgi:hypothetical protein